MDQTTRIFLIRHGESQHNAEDVFSGVTDIDLSPAGRSQCRTLARFFQHVHVHQVYTSPLKRAIETTRIVFPTHKHHVSRFLIEFDYGEYEGKPRAFSEHDKIIQKWYQSPGDIRFPGGGDIQEHAREVMKGLSILAQNAQAETIACVSHRTTIRLIIAQILGLGLHYFRRVPCSNCSITEIHFQNRQGFSLQSLNVTQHYISCN